MEDALQIVKQKELQFSSSVKTTKKGLINYKRF